MPKRSCVLMLGDQTRLQYQPAVSELVAEGAYEAVGPEDSTGDAEACLERVPDLLTRFQPDAACFACGPWDVSAVLGCRAGDPTPMASYQLSLQRIAEKLKRFCGQDVVFIPTLHIDPKRYARHFAKMRPGPAAERDGRDEGEAIQRTIWQYNQMALDLFGQLNVAGVRLNHDVEPYFDEALAEDGVSLTPRGIELVARVVAGGIFCFT